MFILHVFQVSTLMQKYFLGIFFHNRSNSQNPFASNFLGISIEISYLKRIFTQSVIL